MTKCSNDKCEATGVLIYEEKTYCPRHYPQWEENRIYIEGVLARAKERPNSLTGIWLKAQEEAEAKRKRRGGKS